MRFFRCFPCVFLYFPFNTQHQKKSKLISVVTFCLRVVVSITYDLKYTFGDQKKSQNKNTKIIILYFLCLCIYLNIATFIPSQTVFGFSIDNIYVKIFFFSFFFFFRLIFKKHVIKQDKRHSYFHMHFCVYHSRGNEYGLCNYN